MARLTFNYDSLLITGPLTDRKIAAYKKAGYYGPQQPFHAQIHAQQMRNEKRNKISAERRLSGKERKELMMKYD